MDNKACEGCSYPELFGMEPEPISCIWEMEGSAAEGVCDGRYLDANYRIQDGTIVRFLEMDLPRQSCVGCPVAVDCPEDWPPKRKIYVVQAVRPTIQYLVDRRRCESNCNMFVMHCVHSREQALAKIDRMALKGRWEKADVQIL